MGTKDLFENPQGNKTLTSEDFDKEVQKVESLNSTKNVDLCPMLTSVILRTLLDMA